MYAHRLNTDTTTLEGVRNILTIKNTVNRYLPDGPLTAGTDVVCLRTNSFHVYSPCVARIVRTTPSGRITVDLWHDQHERVTVSPKAILWYPETSHKDEA